jgi:hypothetical protein
MLRAPARAAIVALVALSPTACGGAADGPHGSVACVGCHREGAAPEQRAGVPDRACTASGCHPDGGPERARIAMVEFDHRAHPAPDSGAVPCAACHTHRPDSLRLAAGSAACNLCHATDIAGRSDTGCASCHPDPSHRRSTSQGLELAHGDIAAARVPCTRCHYQLLEGGTAVPQRRCAACHQAGQPGARPPALRADSSHREHREFACVACHDLLTHRVVAMSTSIELDCLSCHALRHSPPVAAADSAPDSSCGDCHANVHRDAQRLVLGLLPGEEFAPSAMFMGGVTCRSCHVVPGQNAAAPGSSRRGSPAACTGCHGGAWAGVLQRWRRGYERRHAMVSGYLAGARGGVADSAAPAAARARMREAEQLLSFTRRAGPLHNLPLTDRLMRRALDLAAAAYTAAGRTAPPRPQLGPPVANGTCIACHYGVEEAPIGRDSATGRRTTHADHLFRAGLACDACHAVGAPPPGFVGRDWIDTLGRRR